MTKSSILDKKKKKIIISHQIAFQYLRKKINYYYFDYNRSKKNDLKNSYVKSISIKRFKAEYWKWKFERLYYYFF